MPKKIIAIGDSFLAGSELRDPKTTWPALFAKHHGLDYQCLAQPGHTSQYVLRTLFESLQQETESCFYVLHWPSAMRFEYVDRQRDTWVQINPNAILHGNSESDTVKKCYYTYVNSLLGDKWHNLLMIYSALTTLKHTKHQFAMTVVDDFLFETDFHNPDYVTFLQDQCRPCIHWFDGQTFADWAKRNDFPHGAHGHPLEAAHQAAFKYFSTVYEKLLSNNESLT